MGLEKETYLVLEDDYSRIVYFEMFFNKNKLKYKIFNDADSCINFLKENKNSIKMIFLDHDLGGEIMVNNNYHNTGFTVAKYIKDLYNEDYPDTVIHSHNPIGAENMANILTKALKIPFSFLSRNMRVIN